MKRGVLIVVAVLAAIIGIVVWRMVGPSIISPGQAAPQPTATAAPSPTPEPSPTPQIDEEPTAEPTAVPLEYLFDITVHPPTCVANGYSVYVSRETGGINIRDEVSKLPHDWIEVDGQIVCSMCGRPYEP